jgi:F420-non-reducing hydrogenase large subunit
MRRTDAEPATRSAKEITIEPVTRIEGHARVSVMLDESGAVAWARLHIMSMRGFEKFLEGRAAEEVPGIVTRICGVCPWQHHLASNKAVEGCLNTEVPAAGRLLRELSQVLSHIGDKVLHFFFLAGPDFLVDSNRHGARNIFEIARQEPELAERVFQTRYRVQMMIEKFAGKCIHPDAIVPGGFSRPMSCRERDELHASALDQLEFARFACDFAKERVFSRYDAELMRLGEINTGFLSMVNPEDGSLSLSDGVLRLMRADGSFHEFSSREYTDFLGEHIEPWSYAKFAYARGWGEGFSMDLDGPRGIYRTNCLARLNVADRISTPLAQSEFLEFRSLFGRPAQSTMLYHRARLIELLYCCEKAVEILEDPRITDEHVQNEAVPKAGRGVGCVEAPRGTLIHDYSTDEKGFISRANLIVGTTHNLAPINMSITRAARDLIKNGEATEEALNRIEMAVRAYDPCISCATHHLDGGREIEVSVFDANGDLVAGARRENGEK